MTRPVLRPFILVSALLWALLLGSLAAAQEPGPVDPATWSALASRAEDVLDDETATDAALEGLRSQIAAYRADFTTASGANAERIASLRQQIAALGEPPAEGGEPEPADIVSKRDDLQRQLGALMAPVQVAEAGFTRADGLVGEIDRVLRTRQADKLLTAGPSPLNPVNWPPALKTFVGAFQGVWADQQALDGKAVGATFRDNLLAIVSTALLGIVLLLRGRRWASMIAGSLRRHGARGFGIWRFVVSLLRIALPLAGLYLLTLSLEQSGYFGGRGVAVLTLLPFLGAVMLGFRWVADRVFSNDDDEGLILLPRERRKWARFWVSAITVLIIVSATVRTIIGFESLTPETEAVIAFPFAVIIAVLLFRIGAILHSYREPETGNDQDPTARATTFGRVIRSLGIGAMAVAVVAPVLSTLGYQNLSEATLRPYVVTLVLLGLAMALQRFATDVYGAFTGRGVEARDGLMSVLFTLILLIASAPLLALIWGARVSDLTEMWTAFERGFAVGNNRISPTDFLTFAVIFSIGYVITRLLQSTLRSNVLPKTNIDIGGQNAILSGLGYVGIFAAALAAITGAGIDLSSLAIVAGALSVGIGFGLQTIVSNFVSGIILLIERPISEGDWIEVGGQMGYVRDISVRSTRIETFDKTDVIVPNADLVTGTVTNYTRGNTVGRVIVPVGVAYGTDTQRIDRILREIADAQPMVLANPPPNVFFIGFGADSLDFEIRAFLRDVNWTMPVKSDINHAIAKRFVEEGIEIPFAQRDLWLRNPEALSAAARPRHVADTQEQPKSPNRADFDSTADGEADGDI